jgi:hypothetical protein
MREDQKARLDEIDELLVEQFISEADPRNWPGFGKLPADLTREERGDAHWTRKSAVGTAATLRTLHDLVDRHLGNVSKDPGTQEGRDDDLDNKINKYEQEAARLLEKVQAVGRK